MLYCMLDRTKAITEHRLTHGWLIFGATCACVVTHCLVQTSQCACSSFIIHCVTSFHAGHLTLFVCLFAAYSPTSPGKHAAHTCIAVLGILTY